MSSQFKSLVQIRVEPELREAINSAADRDKTSASEWTRRALRKAVDIVEPPAVVEALARARAGRLSQEDIDSLVQAAHRAPGAIMAMEAYRESIFEEMTHAREALEQAMLIVIAGGNPESLVGYMAQVDNHTSKASAGIRGLGAFGVIAALSEV